MGAMDSGGNNVETLSRRAPSPTTESRAARRAPRSPTTTAVQRDWPAGRDLARRLAPTARLRTLTQTVAQAIGQSEPPAPTENTKIEASLALVA
jgi:hypothetical protein